MLCSSAAAQSGPLYPGPLYVSDDAPSPIVAADMNGDGIKDLVVGNANNTFSIFLGTATGTFGAPSTFAAGGGRGARGGRLQLRRHPDVAIAHALLATTISVALSDGLGGYGAPTDYAVGAGAGHLAAGDFDGDGKQDLVVTNSNAASISILLGNGTGDSPPR